MGTLKKGITGPFTGRVDNLVGSKWRNLNTLRGRPRKSNKPPKPVQIRQRNKVSFASTFLQPFKPAIKLGFIQKKNHLSSIEAAMGELLVNNLKGGEEQFFVNLPTLKLSRGQHYGAASMQCTNIQGSGNLAFSWNVEELNESEQVAYGYDRLTVVMYYERDHRVLNYVNVADRREGSYTAIIPGAYVDVQLHIWCFFTTEDGKISSATQYLGVIVPHM